MNYNKKIPIEQEKIRLFIKSFEDGEYMYYEKFREHPTVTQNGKGAAIWNEIHTQISNNFVSDEFQVGKISRGIWDLVYLYDKRTKYLYTFMREKNFYNLHMGKMSDKLYHYSNVLSRLNSGLLGTYEPPYKQLSFIDTVCIDDNIDTKLGSLLESMISSVDGEVERYAIVLVNCVKSVVKEIECVIPLAYAEPIYVENWSEYLEAEYDIENYDVEETVPHAEEIILYDNDEDIDLSIIEDEEDENVEK